MLKSGPRDSEPFTRMYFQDGLVQNIVGPGNRSLSMYTYALEALAFSYRPDVRKALVLGIGAGMVPMRLAGRGIDVTTVDIDPASLRAATDIFGFDPRKVNAYQADARTFLNSCNGGYDVVIIDLFHGDGVPDYLVTRDFFRDLKHCLGANGIAVFNTFADLDHPRAYAHFLTTLNSELPFMTLYRPDYGLARHINSFIVAEAVRRCAERRSATISTITCHCGTVPAIVDDAAQPHSARPTPPRGRPRNHRRRQPSGDGPRQEPVDQPPLRRRGAAGGVFRELDSKRSLSVEASSLQLLSVASRYPVPASVRNSLGRAGSSSSLCRRQPM